MSSEEDKADNKTKCSEKTDRGIGSEQRGKDPEVPAQMEAVGRVMRKYRDTLQRLADS
jgi:hypothetical protein